MTAFSKKIQKIKKNPKNCIVLGSMFRTLEESHWVFDSVFLINNNEVRLRKKNIIYRETYDSISMLPDIDFIFIDKEYLPVVENLNQVWRKYKPFILIEGSGTPDKNMIKFFKNENYFCTWVDKNFSFWEYKIK